VIISAAMTATPSRVRMNLRQQDLTCASHGLAAVERHVERQLASGRRVVRVGQQDRGRDAYRAAHDVAGDQARFLPVITARLTKVVLERAMMDSHSSSLLIRSGRRFRTGAHRFMSSSPTHAGECLRVAGATDGDDFEKSREAPILPASPVTMRHLKPTGARDTQMKRAVLLVNRTVWRPILGLGRYGSCLWIKEDKFGRNLG